jgi:hypothetical protein
MFDADWRTCGTQAHEELSSRFLAERTACSELMRESADLLTIGGISSCHHAASSQYSHALTLAYTVT